MAENFKDISTIRSITLDKPKPKRVIRSQLDKLEKEHSVSPLKMEDDGSFSFDLSLLDDQSEEIIPEESQEHTRNLVDDLDAEVRTALGLKVRAAFDADKNTLIDWEQMIQNGSSLLGLKLEEKNTPFRGACSAHHPLLMESAVKFQSKASNELLPANGPVKCRILGESTLEKEDQANRVAAHMNYQITEEMTEFYPDMERMLLYVPLFGSGFKKSYYSFILDRPVSEFVPADQIIVANNAPDLYRAERYTHVLFKTRHDLEADFASGLYVKPERMFQPTSFKVTEVKKSLNDISGVEVEVSDANHGFTLYEQHSVCYIEGLDEDDSEFELAKPYILTIDADTAELLGVRRNWKETDPKKKKKVPFTHYQFVPGFGFYGFGFLHLLGNLQLTLTSSLRSLVDAGQFSNLQGGFKLKGVRILDDGEPIYPGQFKEIDAGIMDINKSIMRLPFGEPSPTLMTMLQFLDAKGQKFADATEQIIGDSTNYGPVGTTLALLDASTKFFSAIHKRLHNSLKQELKIIADINAEHLPDDLEYNVEAASMSVSKDDYNSLVDVIPVSDPNVSSNTHRMAKAQTILQVAQMSPEQHDMREVLKHFYSAMDFQNIDKLLPAPEEAQAQDPMTDIQLAASGKPIKAFPGQDHKAHIAIKQAFLQDPMSGKNPIMQKAAMAIQANIQEHMLLSFMEQVQAVGGDPAQAAQQVAQQNQQVLEQQMQDQSQNTQDQAAMLLAQAELLDSVTQAKKQEFEELYKTADLELKKEELDMKKIEEARRGVQLDKQLMHDMDKIVTTKALDAMVKGLSAETDLKKHRLTMAAQKERSNAEKTKKD